MDRTFSVVDTVLYMYINRNGKMQECIKKKHLKNTFIQMYKENIHIFFKSDHLYTLENLGALNSYSCSAVYISIFIYTFSICVELV